MWWLAAAWASGVASIDQPLHTGQRAASDAAVVVGLEDYAFLPDVPYADRDAQAFYDFLVSTRGIPVGQIHRLTTGGREQILAAVEAAAAHAEPGGTVWIYFAGHGGADPSSAQRLVLGDDARSAPEAFAARGIALPELEARASAGGARVALVVDACFNGLGRSGEAVTQGTRFAVPDFAQPSDGALWWTAAGPDQLARPLPGVGHGAFTFFALGALRGWADGAIDGARDGAVTAAEAQVYLSRGLSAAGVRDQAPILSVQAPEDWILSSSVFEPPPPLDPQLLVAAPAQPSPQPQPSAEAPVTSLRWDPQLWEASARLGIALPLRRGMFGHRDAEGARVRGDDYMRLVRATDRGKRAIRTRTLGITATSVGWALVSGFGVASMLTGEPELIVTTGAGGVVTIAGVGMIVGGQEAIQRSVEPL